MQDSLGERPAEERADLLTQIAADREMVYRGLGGNALVGKQTGAAGYVTHRLFARVVTNSQGVVLLIERGLSTEAGVLALAMFEAKLDMMYIGFDDSRGDFWFRHSDAVNQPWKSSAKDRRSLQGRGSQAGANQSSAFCNSTSTTRT